MAEVNFRMGISKACQELLDDPGWYGPFKQDSVALLLATTAIKGRPAQFQLILTDEEEQFITTDDGLAEEVENVR